MCAALTRRGGSIPPVGGHYRGLAPSWCRHDATDRVAKAASDGFELVETGELTSSLGQLPIAGDNNPRVVRHVSHVAHERETSPSTFHPVFRCVSQVAEVQDTSQSACGQEFGFVFVFLWFETQASWLRADKGALPVLERPWLEKITAHRRKKREPPSF